MVEFSVRRSVEGGNRSKDGGTPSFDKDTPPTSHQCKAAIWLSKKNHCVQHGGVCLADEGGDVPGGLPEATHAGGGQVPAEVVRQQPPRARRVIDGGAAPQPRRLLSTLPTITHQFIQGIAFKLTGSRCTASKKAFCGPNQNHPPNPVGPKIISAPTLALKPHCRCCCGLYSKGPIGQTAFIACRDRFLHFSFQGCFAALPLLFPYRHWADEIRGSMGLRLGPNPTPAGSRAQNTVKPCRSASESAALLYSGCSSAGLAAWLGPLLLKKPPPGYPPPPTMSNWL